ncbi:MAG: DUF4249 family protein, partial [Salinimicrobium sp.]
MKVPKMLFLILIAGSLLSCEDVVDVDLEEAAPRLVVEASLLWDIENDKDVQYIRLTTTTPYFESDLTPAKGATVSVYNEDGTEFLFEEEKDGLFKNDEIEPLPEEAYKLVITYQDEVYEATEQYKTTPKLEYVEQNNEGGFTGDDIELKIFYQDP